MKVQVMTIDSVQKSPKSELSSDTFGHFKVWGKMSHIRTLAHGPKLLKVLLPHHTLYPNTETAVSAAETALSAAETAVSTAETAVLVRKGCFRLGRFGV